MKVFQSSDETYDHLRAVHGGIYEEAPLDVAGGSPDQGFLVERVVRGMAALRSPIAAANPSHYRNAVHSVPSSATSCYEEEHAMRPAIAAAVPNHYRNAGYRIPSSEISSHAEECAMRPAIAAANPNHYRNTGYRVPSSAISSYAEECAMHARRDRQTMEEYYQEEEPEDWTFCSCLNGL
jgi:Na+-transporting methylmalonyl-CoA/oxaloacetate decarboxylase gamma subunit